MIAGLLGVVAACAVIGLGVTVWLVRRGRRRRGLRRMAAGLRFRPLSDPGVLEACGLLEEPMFATPGGQAENAYQGEIQGATCLLFEYSSPGRVADPVAFVDFQEHSPPSFKLRPRTGEDAGGFSFTGHGRFRSLYTLTGEHETAVRQFFRDTVVAFFERSENQSWALVSNGRWLGVTAWPLGQRSHPLDPKYLVAFVEDVKLIVALLTGRPLYPRFNMP